MRANKTKNWPKFLQGVVRSLNNETRSSLGGLTPNSVKTRETDIFLRDHLKTLGKWKEPNSEAEQEIKLNEIMKARKYKNFTPGSYVMLDYPDEAQFKKGFQLNVSCTLLDNL